MHPRTNWSQLDEYDRVSELLSFFLDQHQDERTNVGIGANRQPFPARLYGVTAGARSFKLTAIDLDTNDPIRDLWSLSSHPSPDPTTRAEWSWVLVLCETHSGGELAVGVSSDGATLIELRTNGLTTLRSADPASGMLVEACTSLFRM